MLRAILRLQRRDFGGETLGVVRRPTIDEDSILSIASIFTRRLRRLLVARHRTMVSVQALLQSRHKLGDAGLGNPIEANARSDLMFNLPQSTAHEQQFTLV